jgi:hypothetical protein
LTVLFSSSGVSVDMTNLFPSPRRASNGEGAPRFVNCRY